MYSLILAITVAWSKVKDQLGVPRNHLVVLIRPKLSNQAKIGQLDGCIKIIRGLIGSLTVLRRCMNYRYVMH